MGLLITTYANLVNVWKTSGEAGNHWVKNNQEMLLDHTDFALQEQAEDNLMVAFS